MYLLLLLIAALWSCAPAFAGLSGPSTPELDPGTLAALTSGITGAYFVYRMNRAKTKR